MGVGVDVVDVVDVVEDVAVAKEEGKEVDVP